MNIGGTINFCDLMAHLRDKEGVNVKKPEEPLISLGILDTSSSQGRRHNRLRSTKFLSD